MLKVFATQVVVSKGYDNNPALRFSEKGESVRFRIGKKVYDPHAENESRWINLSVKAFNGICERIKKMQLKEGSYINVSGRLDEETWTDQDSGQSRSTMVIILDDIEYASSGSKSKENQTSNQGQNMTVQNAPAAPTAGTGMSDNFTGYEPFGSGSFFDEN